MPVLELTFESGEDSLSVRRFAAREALSSPFRVDVWALSPDQDIDLSSIVGRPAALHVVHGTTHVLGLGERTFRGVVSTMVQTQAESTGLSAYELTLVPAFALLAHRRDHRIFQHLSVPDIVQEILDGWKIEVTSLIERGKYPPLEMRVQHGEPDLDFVCRLLEEAGIAYLFDDAAQGDAITLVDRPHAAEPRPVPLPYVDNPNRAAQKEYVTRVSVTRQVRPGAHAVRDYDLRNPGYPVLGTARTPGFEERLERYAYAPGAFSIEGQRGSGTPVADRHGVARHSEPWAQDSALAGLAADRTGDRHVAYETNVADLRPGTVFTVEHPHPSLSNRPLLVTDLVIDGTPDREWTAAGRAVFADTPHRPPRRTPKPRVRGLQSALVTGPAGEEIHTDELGRVRARFAWDRGDAAEDRTSCWLRVSQAWAGTGFGWTAIPRVGQEVVVAFFEDDPDQPVIVSGAYNGASPQPYPLPQNKTASGWQSQSAPSSDGFNELWLDDATRRELFYLQAQQDLSELVRRNETETTLGRLSKLVKGDETQTTGKQRTEITHRNRKKRVEGDHAVRVEGQRTRVVQKAADIAVQGSSRTLVEGDSDLAIHGGERVKIGGTESSEAGEHRQEVVFGRHAAAAGTDIHIESADLAVVEGLGGITLKTPGGFVLIDSSGIVIKGPLVKINSGGAAGSGGGSAPEAPDAPHEVDRFDPPMPYGDPNPDGDAPPEVEPEETPAPPPATSATLTWIEIVLEDGDGEPVGGERYRIITPDGKVRQGNLDGEGWAREEGLVPGQCQITFPDLDEEDWD